MDKQMNELADEWMCKTWLYLAWNWATGDDEESGWSSSAGTL